MDTAEILERWEMKRMKLAAKMNGKCDCSLCLFFPKLGRNEVYLPS